MALSNKAKNYIRKNRDKKSVAQMAEALNADPDEIRSFLSETEQPLSAGKKAAFYTITLAIPVLFFVLLEAGLHISGYMGDTDLFVEPNIQTGDYRIPNSNFASRYFFYTKTIPNPSTDAFLQHKPDNGFRVFALGGSSAAGYPYGFNGTFSRVVDDVLSDALPDREVEVVNLGISAVNTYTLFDQVDEVLEEQPDAIMIYAGHNEFYGALGVGSNENLGAFPGFVRFYLKLQRFKTFMLLREGIVYAGKWFSGIRGTENDPAKSSATLMERIVKSRSIELNGTEFDLAMQQFRSNMEAILDRFQEAGVPVYIGTIASNVKDQPPFVDVNSEDLPVASEVFTEATTLLTEADTLTAARQFEYAKDLDGLKFRAPSEINSIIKELSGTYNQVYLVDSHAELEAASPAGIIGNELMLEHLHPNQEGYFLIGKSFSEALLRDYTGLPENSPLNLSEYREKMYLSDFDERMVWHRIRTLKQGFPFIQDGSGGTYQLNYKPEGYIDSLAFMNVHGGKRWDESKVEIARFYEQQGRFNKAIYEYRGLIRNQPWNDSPYLYAARIYLDQGNYTEAKPLLEEAYSLNPEEAFTTKMLGAIELDAGNINRAIELLEESYEQNPDDVQMLYNLSGAYGTNREFRKALDIVNEALAISPGFPGLRGWKNQLEQIIKTRGNN